MSDADPYTCRRCGTACASWEIFETGWPNRVRLYCLACIPRWVRLKMWLRGIN
jgi:hypothetical protein